MRTFLIWPLTLCLGTALAAPPPAATLIVVSDPAGAVVVIDGRVRGQAPLEFSEIAPGPHRLLLDKKGYLENSRLLKVGAGERRQLKVSLTPLPASAAQVEEAPRERKGGSKLKWIVPAALGAGAAAFLLLRNTNKPPVAGTVSVSPNPALATVSSATVSANGFSDPDGDALSYSWNFGDGGSASGQTATYRYPGAGNFTITVTASDGKAQVTASTSIVVRSLSGTWNWQATGVNLDYSTTQNGAAWTGSATNLNRFDATLQDPRNITMSHAWSGCPTTPRPFTGQLSTDLNSLTINGSICNGAFSTMTWVRR